MRRLALLPLLILAGPAGAADRTIGVGSFDRLRVDGAFEVRLTAGGSPRARVSGEAAMLDQVDLQLNGTTLTLRRRGGIAARATTVPIVVTLSTPRLVSAAMTGGGTLAIAGLLADTADLSLTGTGTMTVDGVAAEQLSALAVGSGRITLSGRATRVRLSTNGAGTIDAGALQADDLAVRMDGPGETIAQARYVAAVTSTGIGKVTVSGRPRCTVRAPAGGVVKCGE